MEENSLLRKIKKQGELISQQVQAFRKSFQYKNVNHLHFVPYLQSLQNVFNLNYSYGADYFQFISKDQLQQVLANNKVFISDLISKFKFVASLMNQSQVKPIKIQQTNICDVCKQDKMVKNLQKAKQIIQQDVNLTSLRNMIKNLQRQSNILFSQDEDKIFYKHLHRALEVKQDILNLRDNHIQQYLEETIKYLGQIKSIQDNKYQAVEQTPHRIDWSVKIKEQLNEEFLKAFKGKVPPWVQKMFQKFMTIYKKIYFKVKQSKSVQTGEYVSNETIELKRQIQEFKVEKNEQRCIRQQYLQEKQNLQTTVSLLKTQIDMINQEKMKNIILLHQSKTQSLRNSIASNKPLESQAIARRNQNKFKTQMPNITNSQDINQRISMNSSYNQKQNLREQPSLTQHRNSNFQITNTNKKKNNRKITDITTLKKKYDEFKGFLPDIFKGKEQNSQGQLNQLKKMALNSNKFNSSDKANSTNHERTLLKKISKDGNFQIEQIQEKLQLQEIQNNMEAKLERIKSYKKRVSMINQQLLIKRNSVQKDKNKGQITQNISYQHMNGQKSKFAGQNLSPRAKKRVQSSNKTFNYSSNSQYISNYNHTNQSMSQLNQTGQRDYQSQQQTILTTERKTNDIESIQVQADYNQTMHQNNKDLYKTHQNQAQKFKKTLNKQVQSHSQANKRIKVEKCVQTQNNQFYDILKSSSNIMQKLSIQNFQSIAKKLLLKKEIKQNKKIGLNNSYRLLQKNKPQSKTIKKLKGILTQNVQKSTNQQKEYPKKFINDSTNVQSLNESIISQNNVKYQKQQKQNKILTKKDLVLFLNQQSAYQYQVSLKKKYHKAAIVQLSQQEKAVYKSVYSMIQLIKKHSPQIHKKLLAFVRYPYHTIANDFQIIDIVKEMNCQSFLQYMSRIKHFHKKCEKIGQKNHCQHLQYFIQKVQNILVDLTYENDFEEQKQKENIQKMQFQEKGLKNSEQSHKVVVQLQNKV